MALWAPAAPLGTSASRETEPRILRLPPRRPRASPRAASETRSVWSSTRTPTSSSNDRIPEVQTPRERRRRLDRRGRPRTRQLARRAEVPDDVHKRNHGTTQGRASHPSTGGVQRRARARRGTSALDESDVWLHAAPMFHAMDAFTYAMILVGGSQIGRRPDADVFDPREVARVVADRRVTVTAFAAAQLAAVLEVAASSARASASPSLVRSRRFGSSRRAGRTCRLHWFLVHGQRRTASFSSTTA